MKYYIDEHNTLYRLENDKYEMYTYECGSTPIGYWKKNIDINSLTLKEITNDEKDKIISQIDDDAYEDYHSHLNYELLDSKGRKHTDYIYQDYRSIDNYDCEDGFSYGEIMYREDYDYYIYTPDESLIKIDKDDNKIYEFCIENDNSKLKKSWYELDNIDKSQLVIITDFNEVLKYIEDFYYEVYKYYDN